MAKTTPAETTEVVLRDGSKGLVTPEFADNYPALAPDEETLELLEENLGSDGENIGVGNFKRVKVPSGEQGAWMLSRAGKTVAEEEITGVIVAWKARRSFWLGTEPDGSAPDCSSLDNRRPVAGGLYAVDGERGSQNPTGACRTCPMAQFGSDPKGGRGTACREQRLLFMVVPGSLFPIVVHVPRTSLKGLTEFMLDLMDQRAKYHQVEVGLSLVKEKNKAGQEYNRIKPRVVRMLEPGERDATKIYSDQIKAMVEEFTANFDPDSVTEEGEGGISVAPDEHAEQPA
jgi:hypothetical protein